MEWARLVLDYVDALAWPLAVVILVLLFVILFKENIGRLIDRMRSVSGPGGSRMDFGVEVLELVEQASESELSKASLSKTDSRITDIIAGSDIEQSLRRAFGENRRRVEANVEHRPDNNYRGVILDSWLEVEHKLIGVADVLDLGLGPEPGRGSCHQRTGNAGSDQG